MGDHPDLEAVRRFWRTLFEEQEIARRIAALAEETSANTAIVCNISQYGEVRLKVHSTSSLGDNFMSDAYVISAHVVDGVIEYSSFIKVLPSNSVMRESAKEWSLHEREASVYQELFKVLYELRGDRPVPLDVPLVYYSNVDDLTDGSATCILMENLVRRGYRMADKVHGVNDAHVRVALASLAHYHSLTIGAIRQWWDPSIKQMTNFPVNLEFLLEKTLLEMNPAGFIKGWVDVYRDFCRDVQRTDLVEWFDSISSSLEDIMVVDTVENSGPLACILHGDFWNNNMLYKYSQDDEPIGLKMVDFQIARFGHPLHDVLYFIFSSASPNDRHCHLEDWLRFYFETLTSSLELLGEQIKGYGWEDFMADYKKKSIASMLYGSLVISLALNQKVVDGLNDLHEEQSDATLADKPQPTDESAKELVPGMDFTEKLTNILNKNKLSNNPIVANRLITLWDEVKTLNESN